ncbi:MAG: class I SAM-dependent methyltransferase [Nocardioides sp.]|nr:class I SAM-dependent methyltransferase [Nocardioides sp.]
MSNPLKRLYPEIEVGGYSRDDKTAEFYGRINALLTPESVVVDFGAGRGGFMDDPDSYLRRLQLIRGRVARVVGIDIDPIVKENPSVDEAQVWQPGERIDLPDESVDLVFSDYTFEHVDDPSLVVPELQRILKPGGWICARTPNKWGYIALGARMVPNKMHARVLERLQPARAERDVFPTRYRMNTLGALRQQFPERWWKVTGYTVNGEPVYFGSSRVLIYGVYGVSKLLPQKLGAMCMFFVQKRRVGTN